ncbi:MAG: ABC transporter substrate-binding protein [Nitrososphaerota archaeon]
MNSPRDSKNKISRREFLALSKAAAVGGVVGGLVVGGIAGYFAGLSAAGPGRTQTVTQTATVGGAAVTTTATQVLTQTITHTIRGGEFPETIRIGLGAFLSGPFVSEGEHILNGAKLAIKEAKEWFLGGGRNIELVVGDLGSVTPDEVKRAFELFETSNTHINICYWGSYGPGWDSTLKTGIPLITGDTPMGVTDFIAAHPEIRLAITYSPVATGRYAKTFLNFLDWLKMEGKWQPRHNPPTMYIVHSDFTWDADWAKVMQPLAEKRGWKIVGYDLVPTNTLDWSPVLSKIRTTDPDVIMFCDLIPADAGTFTAQFTANPTKSLLCNTWGFAAPESVQVADPESLIGALWGSGTMPIEGPILDSFVNKYRNEFNKEPYISASHIYDSINIALKAIQSAGSTDPAKVYNAIFEIAHQGVEGRWVFDRNTKIHLDSPDTAPNQILQIQIRGGKIYQYNTIYPPEVAFRTKFELPPWLQ